ncbi:SGNH/GDSL hydrolase family protein [Cognatitamlana onchidii]|uniref:hypothetical protein n=1 Tax=Cognatitamlana onchidii TaxID=2562860 RepID=UPI0010A63F26|nr:hypothetical protein [Algibacter onchidii]
MKRLQYILIIISLLFGTKSFGQSYQDTLKVLFVGNSYTYRSNIPHLVSLISDFTQTKLITSKSAAGGAKLSDHWRGNKGLKTLELINNGNYDIVILQDQSMSAIQQPDSLLFYSKKFSDYIRKHGARPYLYATWARKKVPQYQKIITDVYAQAARKNNIGIVPVGESWKLAQTHRPTIELYHQDGSHQSPLGGFLTACTFVKELSTEIPEQLPRYYKTTDENGESVELLVLDPLDVVFCLKVVNDMYK